MKKILLLLFIFTILAGILCADVYIKEKSHRDAFYGGGITTPAMDKELELWIGKNKIVSFDKSRMIILDKTKNLICFVNKNDKTYVEAAVPVDPSKVLDEQTQGFLKTIKFRIILKDTGKTQKIKKWKCKIYKMDQWIEQGENRFEETETNFWAARKVPFDPAFFNEMFKNLLRLVNSDESLFEEVDKMKGYVVKAETKLFSEGKTVKSSREVVEISKKKPPVGVYAVPDGYTKKEKLTFGDLRILFED